MDGLEYVLDKRAQEVVANLEKETMVP